MGLIVFEMWNIFSTQVAVVQRSWWFISVNVVVWSWLILLSNSWTWLTLLLFCHLKQDRNIYLAVELVIVAESVCWRSWSVLIMVGESDQSQQWSDCCQLIRSTPMTYEIALVHRGLTLNALLNAADGKSDLPHLSLRLNIQICQGMDSLLLLQTLLLLHTEQNKVEAAVFKVSPISYRPFFWQHTEHS